VRYPLFHQRNCTTPRPVSAMSALETDSQLVQRGIQRLGRVTMSRRIASASSLGLLAAASLLATAPASALQPTPTPPLPTWTPGVPAPKTPLAPPAGTTPSEALESGSSSPLPSPPPHSPLPTPATGVHPQLARNQPSPIGTAVALALGLFVSLIGMGIMYAVRAGRAELDREDGG
jgi:hypothetical protein